MAPISASPVGGDYRQGREAARHLRVSLCRLHHDDQHRIGADAFGQKYKIDLWASAAEFARRSPDWEMRALLILVHAAEIGNG